MNTTKTMYATLKSNHELYLKKYGVKLPGENSKLGISLTYLYEKIGTAVHIDEIKEFVIQTGKKLTGTDPLQIRHLSTQLGWYIEKDGKYKHRLVTIDKPLPGFIAEKRLTKLNEENWLKLKLEYNNTCVNCGSKEGEPMRWKSTALTSLQQGHMDPRKDLTYDNCIPQCGFCNQQYKSKAIFNKRGIVIDFCKQGF